MTPQRYNVLSPECIPVSPEPFDSLEAAVEFAQKWCERYERQGYYATAAGTRVSLEDLQELVSIQLIE